METYAKPSVVRLLDWAKFDAFRSKAAVLKIPNVDKPVWGFDPGSRNMGVAVLHNELAYLYEIEFKTNGSITDRLTNASAAIQMVESMHSDASPALIAMESASHGSRFGQASLAENRSGLIHEVLKYKAAVHSIPPKSVLKLVFGTAKQKAYEQIPELKRYPNAVAAYTVAVAGIIKEFQAAQAVNENGG